MPKHAALAVGHGGVLGGLDSLLHCEILVVRRQHLEGVLPVYIETDEVFQNVQKAALFKQPLKEGIKLGVLGIFVAAIFGFPLHKAILARGDSTRLGGGQVAHDADCVVDEQGRDLIHIVAQLPVCGRGIGLLPGGGLQLYHHQWQTVDKQNHIRAFLGVLHNGPLVDNGKIVVG